MSELNSYNRQALRSISLGVAGIVFLGMALVLSLIFKREIYYLTTIHFVAGVICLGIYFFAHGLKIFRSERRQKHLVHSIQASIYSGIFLLLVAIINYGGANYSLLRIDTTRQGVNTLAPQTKELLKNLDSELTIRTFFLNRMPPGFVRDLVQQLSAESKQIKAIFLDPEQEQEQALRFSIPRPEVAVVSYKEKSVLVDKELSEQEFVNALERLVQTRERFLQIAVDLSDVSEKGFSTLSDSLKEEGFTTLDKLEFRASPKSAAPLLLVSGERDETLFREQALAHFKAGGSGVLLYEPLKSNLLNTIAEEFGLKLGSDLVVDSSEEDGSYGIRPLVKEFSIHEITEALKGAVRLTSASSILVNKSLPEMKIVKLLQTSPESWAETNLTKLLSDSAEAGLDETDIKGPITVAAAIERDGQRVVVIGDSDFARNKSIREHFNRDLVLNALRWTLGEKPPTVIRARTFAESRTEIPASTIQRLFLLTTIIIPELILLSGLIFWIKRKS
ncbi:Gldg family protein [bacterium]|nr:Gldg family protein [bacterium]